MKEALSADLCSNAMFKSYRTYYNLQFPTRSYGWEALIYLTWCLLIQKCFKAKQTRPGFKVISPKLNGYHVILSMHSISNPYMTNSAITQPSWVVGRCDNRYCLLWCRKSTLEDEELGVESPFICAERTQLRFFRRLIRCYRNKLGGNHVFGPEHVGLGTPQDPPGRAGGRGYG